MKKIIILILICTMSIFFIGCTKINTKEVNNTIIDTEEPSGKDVTEYENIDIDEETGIVYENNTIIIIFSMNTTDEEVDNIVKTIPGGTIIDRSTVDLNIYPIKLDKKYSLNELNDLCNTLMKNKYVDSASPNYVSEIGLDNE